MYKIDAQTLKEITATLDAFMDMPQIAYNGSQVIKGARLRIKARNLSQKIKDNYTQIKL